jgi:hypothetical protein
MRTPRIAAALSFAAAISLASLPVQAAPLTALSAAAKPAAQDSNFTQVRWGGWHGGGIGFGIGALAAGALIGAAVTSPYYYGGYSPYYGGYSPYYAGYPAYYGGYSYGYPYGYSSAYYPSYSYSYYRPRYRHYAYRHHWRNSYGMYRVHHYRHYRHW